MKKKIVFFIGSLQTGGAERVISEISWRLLHDFDIVIVTYYSKEIFYKIDGNIQIVEIEKLTNSQSIFKNLLFFRSYIKKNRPDVVLSFLTPFNIFSYFALLKTSVPIVLCERSDPRHFSKYYFLRKLRDHVYKYADRIVFQTNMSQSLFCKKIQEHSLVIPNPCYLFPSEIGSALSSEKKKKIVSVSRLIDVKNHKMLIKAFYKIHQEFHGYKLVIYGEGNERCNLQNLIGQLGLNDIVLLPGNVKDVRVHISDAVFFVLSSNYEGMPNALLEAIGLGLPVISTKVSGTEELVKDGDNGFLIDVNDIEGLVLAMRKLLSNSVVRSRMGKKSIEIAKNYDPNRIIDLWKTCILDMIE